MARHDTPGLPRLDPRPDLDTPGCQVLENTVFVDAVSGEYYIRLVQYYIRFRLERGRTQRRGDVTDHLLRLRWMLVAHPD